ncbi:MAG TPA: Clp protease N-terminal domain-containing protein [Acidimicrobiales bacterium]|nr:Clp protease N-terminal domain-containing protein [Acidimicrobiales bacterium]
MPSFPVPLDTLIEYVRELQPESGPLEHLADAMVTAQELGEQSDALIGHFVDQARSSGASWSQIGTAMGVSKQAAQKKFVARDEAMLREGRAFSRFTPRARVSVAAAGRLASGAGDDAVDATHLAAGALADAGGLAARALRRLGVDEGRLHDALGVARADPAVEADPRSLRELSYTPACREAFTQALKAAVRLGHNYIGTEHLLLGATAGEGRVPEAFAAVGLHRDLLEGAVAVEIAETVLELRRQAGGTP